MGVFLDEKLKMESQTRLRWNARILEEFNTVVSIGKKIAETAIDDELTEINEKIVNPSKLKLTADNFLNSLNSLDFIDESGRYASNGPFGPKNILETRN